RLASIKIDVLLDIYDKNLIITKNTGYFSEGKGVLEENIFTYLDEIIELIKDYKTDIVIIKTGSFFSESLNSEYEANRLALLRSESIKSYLIRKGIPEKNIRTSIKIADEKNSNKQKELRRVRVSLEKDLETLKE
ncbi:MAG: OmpA family protein, partial [Brevinema sp.]